MKQLLDKYFLISERGSTVKTELIAGITTFLTVMYIVPLNGIIMSSCGMPLEAVITATALITLIATVFNGLWANTPIAMSVGLGLNSYFAFTLVKGSGLPWQTVLGIVFLSSILFLVLTFTKIRTLIIESITPDFKIAISAGIGLFIAFIGLKEMGIVAHNEATLVTLGNLADKKVLLGVIGIFITIALVVWKIKGAFILSIIATSITGYLLGVGNIPTSIFSLPASISPIFMQLDVAAALKWSLAAPIVTFMLTHLFDSIGTLAGVGFRAGIFDAGDSRPIQRTLESDALASVLGSALGLSTTVSFIESAAGVEEGGRTGLTSVVCGLLFSATLFMLPFFKSIPANAIYPVLIIVGVLMFSELTKIDFSKIETGIPAFLILIIMPTTFSITRGLAVGFISYSFIMIITGRIKELNPVILIISLISVIAFIHP